MDYQQRVKRYVSENLIIRPELSGIQDRVVLLWYASSVFHDDYAPHVYDLLCVLPSNDFCSFRETYGGNHIIDDHQCETPFFVKFRSREWLEEDFARRLPIALWLYEKSIVLCDPGEYFNDLVVQQGKIFQDKASEILRRKYLEFRSERHNLRFSTASDMKLTNGLLKNFIAKLAAEITFLAENKPYPYKKWLFVALRKETRNGAGLLGIIDRFIQAEENERIIDLSEELVTRVNSIAVNSGRLTKGIVNQWWQHLD